MSAQHTPGPWRVGDAGYTIFGPKEADGKLPQRIGEVCAVRESYLANARLIAAAPELLAALREIATADYTRLDVATLGNIARAAITKAVQS